MPTIRLLHCEVAFEAGDNSQSDFRFLVDDQFFKYVTIDAGLYDPDVMVFEPELLSVLPPFPSGDWNTAHIAADPTNGRPSFTNITKAVLPSITHIWHPLKVEYLQLNIGRKLFTNTYEAACSFIPSTPLIVKFARFPWEIDWMDSETRAYEWIQGKGIGPEFLGHVMEQGRTIGFLIAKVEDCRCATKMEDLEACRAVLSRLHDLGIKHGDTNKHNFLMRGDGKAVLIDFVTATRCENREAMDDELRMLEEQLKDESGRGGIVTSLKYT